MIKLKAYDKYNKQEIFIILDYDDEMYDAKIFSNNDGVFYKPIIKFQAIIGDADSCSPKRWSDLENIEIVEDENTLDTKEIPLSPDHETQRKQLIDIQKKNGVIVSIKNNIAVVVEYNTKRKITN